MRNTPVGEGNSSVCALDSNTGGKSCGSVRARSGRGGGGKYLLPVASLLCKGDAS
jgi:hypothetical protein